MSSPLCPRLSIFDENWSVGEVVKNITIGARGLGFDSQAGQIGHSVANGSPPFDISSERCCPSARSRIWAPQFVTQFGIIPQVK